VANHATVEAELAGHAAGLERLPRLLCLSKADLVPDEEARAAAAAWRERLGEAALDVVVTSAATGSGLAELASAILRAVPAEPARAPVDARAEIPAAHRVYRPDRGESFSVEATGQGAFRVTGPGVEKLLARHDLENPDALRYVEERLRGMGVIRALDAAGFEPGDDVEIAGTTFELDPGAAQNSSAASSSLATIAVNRMAPRSRKRSSPTRTSPVARPRRRYPGRTASR
jgi:GTP-binding protein